VIRRVACGDARHELSARGGRAGVEVGVDGRGFELEVRELEPGVFLLREGERSEVFHCVRDGAAIHLFFRGTAYLLREEREGGRAAQRQTGGALEAPMPGKVIKVNVEAGQQVARGAEILVIEAMKMENALRAPRDGRVKSVSAKVGEMVSPGLVLVELE
jgi:3-methylcrotonyl-CoA carboxylase alpha subunit